MRLKHFMKVTIKQVFDFYKQFPQHKGKINVETRWGFHSIEECEITARDSQTYIVECDGIETICSPDHLWFVNDDWKAAKNIQEGDTILTKNGIANVSVSCSNLIMDLYDLQVAEVKEFYANGMVSHNSTISDAICFALFGKPYKKVNKASIVNSINNKGCLAEIDFSVGSDDYTVKRGIKPTVFEIIKNGETLDKDAKATDLQKKLETDILGDINYQIFLQTAMIGSANYVPFMQLTTAQRREVVESILSLRIFSFASNIAKKRIKNLTDEKNEIFSNIRVSKNSLEEKTRTSQILLAKKESAKTSLDEERKIIDEKIASIENSSGELKKQLLEIKHKVSELIPESEDQSKLNDLKTEGVEKSAKMKSLQEKISLWDLGNCPTCGTPLSKESNDLFDYNGAVEEVAEIESVLDEYRETISKGTKINKEIEDLKSKGKNILQEVKNNESKLEHLKESLELLENRKEEQFDSEFYDQLIAEIDEVKALLEQQESSSDILDDELQYVKLATNLFKDDGIKARIIKVFVPLINKYVNEYLQEFEIDMSFEFDENFDEKILGRGRDDYVYNNLSEGEKKRVDLAVLFSWLKIAETKNSANMNILVADELMDGALDYDSIQNMVKILRNLITESNKSIFIISHREELKEAFFDKVFMVKKEGQFSQIDEI